MKRFAILALALSLLGCGATYRNQDVAITSMALFDPAKYAGLWYEVARFPNRFQSGCLNSQADYAVAAPGALFVRNSCFRDGGLDVIEGTATVDGPGRLRVRLGKMPFPGDYWVLWVDEGYQTAVVGLPSGRAGWILSRTPKISPDRLEAARAVLQFNGYDIAGLTMTPQEGAR